MKKMIKACVFMMTLLAWASAAESAAQVSDGLSIVVDGAEACSRGEVAAFYITTIYGSSGRLDANITNSGIYYGSTLVRNLTSSVRRIGVGFFWVRYLVPDDAVTGTYALLIEAEYTINATKFGSATLHGFTVSTAWTDLNDRIKTIEDNLGLVSADIDEVKSSLSSVSIVATNIEESIDTIIADVEQSTNTIKSDIRAMNGSLANLSTLMMETKGSVAAIKEDVKTLKVDMEAFQADVINIGTELSILNDNVAAVDKSINERTATLTTNTYIILAASIAAAAAAIIAFIAIVELGRILVSGLRL